MRNDVPSGFVFTDENGMAIIEELRKDAEPVAWMFVTRDRKSKRRDEFAAIDWSPSPDDDRELISKRPLAYMRSPLTDAQLKFLHSDITK